MFQTTIREEDKCKEFINIIYSYKWFKATIKWIGYKIQQTVVYIISDEKIMNSYFTLFYMVYLYVTSMFQNPRIHHSTSHSIIAHTQPFDFSSIAVT